MYHVSAQGVDERMINVHYYYYYNNIYICHWRDIVQELCESRGGRPGLSILTSLLVSVDVKLY